MNGQGEEDGSGGGGLSAGRSRRSTAGNRMRELLEQERERLELKRGNEENDEMFKEEEEDVDFEARGIEEAEDIIDSDFDQSSIEGGEDDDDELEGERQIEEEERIAKKQSRNKAIAAAPGGIRKVAMNVPKASTSSSHVNDAQSASRKSISFASAASGEGIRQRSSARKSTVNASLSVQARMKLEEKRRQEASEKAIPKRKKVRLSQADRIAEALEMEDFNRESLSKYLKLEEERRERDRRQSNKQIVGPWIRFRSVAEDRNAQQRMIQIIREEKRVAEKAEAEAAVTNNGTLTTDPVIAAREGAKKEREDQIARAPSEAVLGQPTMNDATTSTAPSVEVVESEEISGEHSRTTTATDTVMTDIEGERKEGIGGRNSENVVEEDINTARNDGQVQEEIEATSQEVTGDKQQGGIVEAPAVLKLAPEYETRSYVSLHQLPDDTPWYECWSFILGSHVDWSHFSFVPARNRPLRPRQSVCPITGLAAVYKDPRNGIAYANKEAYDMLTRVMAGDFHWSGKPLLESESESFSSPAPSASNINGKYDPLEMGCWLDSINEKGACHVLDKAAETVTPVMYRSRATVAPGDEQAIVEAAQALPAGTTRSGTRRAPEGTV